MLPEVTVIISTYNCSKTLQCAIQSVLNQDFQDFEIQVIGDGCTDDSEAVVSSFNDSRLFWFNLPENIGSQYAPNNEGLKRANGKYIAYLGHDDLWFPDHLTKLKSLIELNDFEFVHCLTIYLRPDGKSLVTGPPAYGRTYSTCHVPPSSWFHKKSIIDKCGYWTDQKKISIGCDSEYLRRLASSGIRIGFLPDLFILKFISFEWGIYSKKTDFPQVELMSEMNLNVQKLQQKLLINVANSFAVYFNQRFTFKSSAGRFIENTLFLIYNFYSRDRWPLNKILTFYFQHLRKKQRKGRGLIN